MKYRIIALALVVACSLADSARAFVTILPKAQGAKPQAAADIQDLVFRAEDGLYKVRLHVSVNGKSASANWGAFLDRAFTYFDRNGDGVLDAKEVAKMVPANAFLQGINFVFNGGNQPPKLADLDTNKDGKVDRAEFATYFRRNGLGAVQVNVQPPNAAAEQLTSALYKHLGAKGGKLTQADLAAAWERLQKLDQDEDEIISSQELLERQFNPFYQQTLQLEAYTNYGQPQPVAPASFIAITPGEPASASAAKVMQALQAGKQPYLAFTAARTSAKLPAFLRSGLQKIDQATIAAWLELPPDLELNIQLGTIAEGIGRLMGGRGDGVSVRKSSQGALAKATALGPDGRLRLTTPAEMVEFIRGVSTMGDPMQYYRQQFKTEADAKLYMDKEQLRTSPQLQFLVNIFDVADRDGDGKLFVEEFNAFMDLLRSGNTCQINVQVLDQGRGLFDLIDTNRDQRLSRRELMDAAKKFATFDRNGDGVLERSELPRQLRMTIGQGSNDGQFAGVVFAADGSTMDQGGGRSAPAKGPAWFRKMDRNRDGDVSLREFLGTPEEFKQIDTDGDGLISAAEAEQYQKRKPQGK